MDVINIYESNAWKIFYVWNGCKNILGVKWV